MKTLVIFISVVMLVASAQAKVLTAKMTVNKHKIFSKEKHGWLYSCSGIDVTVKYNPVTDRGSIIFGESCVSESWRLQAFIRVYDADGFQIGTFDSEHFEEYNGWHIMSTDLTKQERKAIRKISIDFYGRDDIDWTGKGELTCPSNREFNEDDNICERKCDDNHIYDSETDKCEALYDSKATAEYEPVLDEPKNDNVVEEAATTVSESVVSVDQKSETQVEETREQMYARLGMSDMLTSSIDLEPWYSSTDGRWHCDAPYEFDGRGGCFLP